MGKQLRQQRAGRGTLRFRARKKAYVIRVAYPNIVGKGKVIKILHSAVHFAPVALIKVGKENFFNVACEKMFEGQEIEMGGEEVKDGNIMQLDKIPIGTQIHNIEILPLDGGKLVRTGGSSAVVSKKTKQGVVILLPSKQEKLFNTRARATIGVVSASGRLEKPFVKAGNKWHDKHKKGKHYPLTSPIKMNAVAHPFGSGRGKHMGKSGIAPRNAPPGRKVGLIRPRRSGRKKR